MKIVLASKSPRRYEILKIHGYEPNVVPSSYNEKINGLIYTDLLVENCAYQKAFDVKKCVGDDELIISADTVVVNNGIILGKPKDKNDAIKMLCALSNKTHFVATSICIMFRGQILKSTEKTFVTFRDLTEEDILNYIEKHKPFDKAGSYGIQDDGFDFVTKVNGELDNVIGFPFSLFKEQLNLLTI